jgi:hypothetical protein
MNFPGYQQPEFFIQQVMHTITTKQKKIFEKIQVAFEICTTIPKTMKVLKIYRGKICSVCQCASVKDVRRESIGRPLENVLICDGILCHVRICRRWTG